MTLFKEKLCHFWFNTFFLVEPKMQEILIDVNEKSPESKLGTLRSCLISECGLKHLYTMTKADIDGLHKDKFHRLAPSSFTVSSIVFNGGFVLFFIYYYSNKTNNEPFIMQNNVRE